MNHRPYRDLYNLVILFILAYAFVTLLLAFLNLFFAIMYLELLSKDVRKSLKMSKLIQLRAMRLQKIKEIHQQQMISVEYVTISCS